MWLGSLKCSGLFSERLLHCVESVRKEKQKEEETNKHLACKKAKLQENHLSTTQKNEESKTQASGVTVEQVLAYPSSTVTPQNLTWPRPLPDTQVPQGPEQVMAAATLLPVHTGQTRPGRSRGVHYDTAKIKRRFVSSRQRKYTTEYNWIAVLQCHTQLNADQGEELLCWECYQRGHSWRDWLSTHGQNKQESGNRGAERSLKGSIWHQLLPDANTVRNYTWTTVAQLHHDVLKRKERDASSKSATW